MSFHPAFDENMASTGCPKILVSRFCGYFRGVIHYVILVSHSCIGQASACSLSPCMNQSDNWLVIYGRKRARLMVASQTVLPLFSSNVNIT